MKKITLFMMIVGLFALAACQKVDKTQISTNPQASVLKLQDGAVIVLEAANQNVPIIFQWDVANYGPQLVVNYTLQMDLQGNDFADAVAIGIVTNDAEFTIVTSDFNNKLLPYLPDPEVPEPIALEFRVMSGVNPSVTPLYSSVIKQTITPYFVPIVYPVLNVPGSYQGWNPEDPSTVVTSVNSNEMYEGYLWFPDDNTEYKYARGSWDENWGDDNADGTLDPGGANIIAAVAGYYKLNVDLVALTHTAVRTEWGVIGTATPGGWDVSTPMTYDVEAQTWSVTMDLAADEFKFRANDAWDINYGDNEGNGTLQQDGANILVPAAGNYTITLELNKPIYKYKLKAN